jgi:hypothetical protein
MVRSLGQNLAVLPADAPDAKLETVCDVNRFLAETANQVRRGQLAPQVGNCLGCLMGYLLKGLQGSDLEAQMEVEKARTSALEARTALLEKGRQW